MAWFDTNGASFAFRAGQHADFVFKHPRMEGVSDNSPTLSLASSPHDKRPVMIAMRMRKTPFKTALKSAALGTKFIVSRPRGSFTLHRDITRPAVFLAGGIGISPIRSILRKAAQERLPHRLYLFYSNRAADDAAFIEEFEDLSAQNSNFTFIPTLTGHRTISWPYERGYIDREMLSRATLFPAHWLTNELRGTSTIPRASCKACGSPTGDSGFPNKILTWKVNGLSRRRPIC